MRGGVGVSRAAPGEGGEVHLHRLAVERDGALDRVRGQRHQPRLIGVAEHEHIGADGIAERRHRRRRRVDELRLAGRRRLDGALQPLGGQREIRVAGEIAGENFRRVDDDAGIDALDGGEHRARAGDDEIAAEDEVRPAGRDADGVDVGRRARELDVAVDGAALLAFGWKCLGSTIEL